MTQEQAREKILAKWGPWVKEHKIEKPNGTDGLMFFNFIQREHSHLLSFKASGDKWQHIHGWLLRARLLSD